VVATKSSVACAVQRVGAFWGSERLLFFHGFERKDVQQAARAQRRVFHVKHKATQHQRWMKTFIVFFVFVKTYDLSHALCGRVFGSHEKIMSSVVSA
jgi:hypothetical protein